MTRKLILDAGLKTLLEQGIEGFTMDRVAMDAGVAKGTLYLHFKDKEELLMASIEKGFEPFFSTAETVLDSDQSPENKIEAFSLEGFRFFERQRQLFNIVMRAKELKKRHAMEDDALYWNLVSKISRVLDDGIHEGKFKPIDSIKVAGMFLDAQGALILQHLAGKSSGTAEEYVNLVMDVFLNGIRT
ncbi:MAG TPA: TetR/AcrR family transcriptional regulator [Deltaproteobacteria bacterium]|nr:TetR/AcrR family transcriptional regulator [Deltaproteobacteria bacterium]HPJ94253.1 TetR/AcrR family transcriptional regulator [Deltaproteobacteria bacterium]HPR51488.1 TetR/AcrR family transcriptional regulator [Deltaproteobacteria bacterium]